MESGNLIYGEPDGNGGLWSCEPWDSYRRGHRECRSYHCERNGGYRSALLCQRIGSESHHNGKRHYSHGEYDLNDLFLFGYYKWGSGSWWRIDPVFWFYHDD